MILAHASDRSNSGASTRPTATWADATEFDPAAPPAPHAEEERRRHHKDRGLGHHVHAPIPRVSSIR